MELSVTKPEQTKSFNHPKLKGRDIVIISLQPWYYNIGSNCKDIAIRLAQNNRVLYINMPLNRKTFLSNKKSKGNLQHYNIIKQKQPQIREISKKMWEFYPASIIESINWLPVTSLFKKFNYINNRRFAKNIQQALKKLDFKNIIIFNDNDIYNGYYLKKLLSPSLYIYYCRDFLQGYDYWKKHTSVLEPELIGKSDMVVTNSSYYAQYCAAFNQSSYYIGQGCNLNLFDADKQYAIPGDLMNLSNPVIGYVGALDADRLDQKIIEAIALAYKQSSIVLVGPQDETFKNSSLHNFKNIYFLGRKDLQQLPAYINAFDVCINPQLDNTITMGNYPLKIDEYLAMGKPVIATTTKAMKMFEEFIYLATSPADYLSLIKKALAEDTEAVKEKRIAFARSHTWENSMNEFYKVTLKHLQPVIV